VSTTIEPQIGPDGFPYWVKDPSAIKDYQLNWADRLGAKTIATSVWTVIDSGITKGAESHTGVLATVRISAGTRGKRYRLTNHIVDSNGEEDEQTIVIWVLDT
jgi:hypothetical protein